MTDAQAGKPGLSGSAVGALVAAGLISAVLLAIGRRDYPNLHAILDAGAFLLSGVLTLLFWDMGDRLNRPFPKWIAASFLVTSLLELVHVLVIVEWSGPLAFIEQSAGVLRPITWPPAAHLLPIGVLGSLWLIRHGGQRAWGFALWLIVSGAVLSFPFYWLPQYSPPSWLGVTRPTLILAPLLWLAAGLACWRSRAADPMTPMLALMAAVLFLANVSMLYSQAAHDTQAMVAHLGKICGYLILLLMLMRMASLDVLERIRAEAELQRLNAALDRARREAEDASRAKSMFLATMSHEIRTPMNGVIGMIDVLRQSSLRSDQAEMVDIVRESAHSLLRIINDILDFSKIEVGKLEIELHPFSIAGTVESVCGLLNGVAARKHVTLAVFVDPRIPAGARGDSLRLRQVLSNLISNAIKFSGGRSRVGRVWVRAVLTERDERQATVEFRVSDNGVGMSEQTLAQLFTAFTQADVSTTRRFGGTGLGLAISSNLVRMMGGVILVDSVPDQGSTFKVLLSFATMPVMPAQAEPQSPVAGLSCVVVGAGEGLAGDLAAYLEQAHAFVQRVPELAVPGALAAVPKGSPVIVVDAGDDPEAAEQIQAKVRALAGPDAHVVAVLMPRSKREKLHRVDATLIVADGNCLQREVFLDAVAAAAGRISLPPEVGAQAASRHHRPAPTRDDALQRGQLILVAEDNENNQKVILRQLALLGYAADIAPDGHEALRMWRSGHYALLLTDLHMPAMDGYELTRTIRAEESDAQRIPIVALTANVLKGEAERCRAAGMNDYQSKPAPLAELKIVIEKWMPAGKDPGAPRIAGAVPVDIDVLKSLIGDDPAVISEFIRDFRSYAADLAADMRVAHLTKPAAVSGLAHKLKSSARAVGAATLAELCAALEAKGRSGEFDAFAALMPDFESEMATVDGFLAGLH